MPQYPLFLVLVCLFVCLFVVSVKELKSFECKGANIRLMMWGYRKTGLHFASEFSLSSLGGLHRGWLLMRSYQEVLSYLCLHLRPLGLVTTLHTRREKNSLKLYEWQARGRKI